jgi:hypothetical protein
VIPSSPGAFNIDMKPFVPQDAREYFEEILYGIPGQESGARELIEELKSQLEPIRKNLDFSNSKATKPPQEARNPLLVTGHDADWYRVMQESIVVHERIVKNVELLSTRDQMSDAYDRLNRELTTRQQWRAFLCSALTADYKYSRHKPAVKRGKELAPRIASTATKLAELLSEFNLIDFDNFPIEFSSVWHLLYEAKDDTWWGDGPEKRLKFKRLILGEDHLTPEQAILPSAYTSNPSALRELMKEDVVRAINISQRNSGPVNESQLDLQTAWRAAPKLPSLLRCLATSAKDFEPEYGGMIGFATGSRKGTPHTRYARAFGYLLTQVHAIRLNPNIINAMAIITTLVTSDGDPNFEMDYRATTDALKEYLSE